MKLLSKKRLIFPVIIGIILLLIGCSTDQFKHHQIKTIIRGKGKVIKEPNLKNYELGDKITLTAKPDKGWNFYAWGGDVQGDKNPQTLIADECIQVEAEFIAESESYKIETAVEGAGEIELSPDRRIYKAGEEVEINATPDSETLFYHWGTDLFGRENSYQITITEDLQVKANFISKDKTINFSSSNLESIVKQEAGISSGNITVNDVAGIKELDVSSENISNLEGIEYLLNLEHINLKYNEVEDLTPLAGAPSLKHIVIWSNNVSDLTPLSNMKQLESLLLLDNSVSDISPLSELTNLKKLSLSKNNVEDISYLADLTNLEGLTLGENNISDISALSGMKELEILQLYQNNITDIIALSGLVSLKELYLLDNNISDISPLANLDNLEFLWISDNQIDDVAPLSNLTNLTRLYISENKINDISVVSKLEGLTNLNIRNNQVTDISPLLEVSNLQFVNLEGNPLNTTSGSEDMQVINQLEKEGVTVRY